MLNVKTNEFVEEFSTSNFIAIDAAQRFITPASSAILPSITNKSLMELARDEGHEVQRRDIHVRELLQHSATDARIMEIGACGTAVVLTPVEKVVYNAAAFSHLLGETRVGLQETHFPVEEQSSILKKLYNRIRAIQDGEAEDKFHWMLEL